MAPPFPRLGAPGASSWDARVRPGLMDERHGNLRAENLIDCFALVGEMPERCRFFLVPSGDVATYIKWEHRHWKKYSTRRTGRVTSVRTFRIPIGKP